jgi:cytoplasmic iron level regulating protein YaaA (DUF328/UPF0246 family)
VLIVLPPSEGKTAPTQGRRLSLRSLGFPSLTPTRDSIITAVTDLCLGPASKARTTLGISARQDAELEHNTRLRSSACAPAAEVYTGVLYEALDWHSLTSAQRKRAGDRVAIASALFGLVRPTDAIPAYRLSADTTLPGVGRLRTAWSAVLPDALAAAAPRGIVWDLRSSAYVSLGPVPKELAERTVISRVLQDTGAKRVVVSHHNKATKGRLTRAMLSGAVPKTVPDLVTRLGDAGFRVELQPRKNSTSPYVLDVIVEAL